MYPTQTKPSLLTTNEALTVLVISNVVKVASGALLAYTFTSINPMHAAGLCLFANTVGLISTLAAGIFTKNKNLLQNINMCFGFSGAVYFGGFIAKEYNLTVLTPLQSLALSISADFVTCVVMAVGVVAYKLLCSEAQTT